MFNKIVASDMKQATKLIGEHFGDDAIILSCKNTDKGVEVLCSTQKDLAKIQSTNQIAAPANSSGSEQSATTQTETPSPEVATPMDSLPGPVPVGLSPAGVTVPGPSIGGLNLHALPTLKDAMKKDPSKPTELQGAASISSVVSIFGENNSSVNSNTKDTQAPVVNPEASKFEGPPLKSLDKTSEAASISTASAHSPAKPNTTGSSKRSSFSESASSNESLSRQIEELKKMIHQTSESARWAGEMMGSPVLGSMFEEMINQGFSSLFARTVLQKLPKELGISAARIWVRDVVKKNIKITKNPDEMLRTGGVYAVVGPTGSGKTTTTAKIAARAVITSGPDSVGIITTDNYRVGAQDQIRRYGKVLGIQVEAANSEDEIERAAESMQRKKLILVDTMGTANDLNEQESQDLMLNRVKAKKIIALNTALQSEVLANVVSSHQREGLSGCIFTKVDETVRLAGAVDIALRNKLPIFYLATGQRVPEDLYHPSSDLIIKKILGHKTPSAYFINASQLLHIKRSEGLIEES